ncbi:MAG: hypothetical protein HRU15_17595 [Planctomycetes bacterium]|nr:hypothetical protein [Planctomycetota bacterium]
MKLPIMTMLIVGLCAAQLWLMTVSLRAYMAQDPEILWPAAIVSTMLFVCNALFFCLCFRAAKSPAVPS